MNGPRNPNEVPEYVGRARPGDGWLDKPIEELRERLAGARAMVAQLEQAIRLKEGRNGAG